MKWLYIHINEMCVLSSFTHGLFSLLQKLLGVKCHSCQKTHIQERKYVEYIIINIFFYWNFKS